MSEEVKGAEAGGDESRMERESSAANTSWEDRSGPSGRRSLFEQLASRNRGFELTR